MDTQTLTGLRELGIQWGTPDVRALESLYQSKMATKLLDGMEEWAKLTAREDIRMILMQGVEAGLNPLDSARLMQQQLGQTLGSTQARMNNIARTEQLDAYRDSMREGMLANPDVLTGWMWVCVLSGTSCPSCIGQHGSHHGIEERGPDDHPQGRCYRMPETKSWADLGFADIPEPPSLIPDNADWFKGQSLATQKGILGPERYAAWKDGKYPINMWSKEVRNNNWRRSFQPSSVDDVKAQLKAAQAKQHAAALQNAKDMKIKWRMGEDGVVILEEPLTAMRAAHWRKIGLEWRVEKAVVVVKDTVKLDAAIARVKELEARIRRLESHSNQPNLVTSMRARYEQQLREARYDLVKAKKELSAAQNEAWGMVQKPVVREIDKEIADLESLIKRMQDAASKANYTTEQMRQYMKDMNKLYDDLSHLKNAKGYPTLDDAAAKAGRKRAERELQNTYREVNPGKLDAIDKTAFERYSNNCTHCVNTWTLREMGYNVKAQPIPMKLVTNAGKATVKARGRNINDYFQGRWLNPDGSPVTIWGQQSRVTDFSKWDWRHALSAADKAAQEAAVTAAAESWGNGYGIVECIWTGGKSGHVFIVKVTNGVAEYIEPQTSLGWGQSAAGHFKRMTGGTRLIRMDGLIPRETLLEDIVEWA